MTGTSRPSPRGRRAAVVISIALTGLAGCAAPDGPANLAERDAAAAPGSSAAMTPGPSEHAGTADVTAGPATTTVPEPGVLPRSLTYSMLTWTVTDAAITDADPRTYLAGDEAGPSTSRTSLVVDLDVRNDDPHVHFASTAARLVATLPDGTEVIGTHRATSGVPPVSTATARHVFEVPAGTSFEGLVLAFRDPGREPSFELPLSGAPRDDEANQVIEANLDADLAIPGIQMTWTVGSVFVGRDWPLPVGFKGGTLVPGARASEGTRLVGAVARVEVAGCDCPGGVLDQAGSARLLVDGTPHTAAAASSSRAILQAQSFSEVMLVFEVPASAASVILQVGPLEQPDQQARFELPLD